MHDHTKLGGVHRASRVELDALLCSAREHAVEIPAHAGDTTQQAAERCVAIDNRVVALLTGFIR